MQNTENSRINDQGLVLLQQPQSTLERGMPGDSVPRGNRPLLKLGELRNELGSLAPECGALVIQTASMSCTDCSYDMINAGRRRSKQLYALCQLCQVRCELFRAQLHISTA